MSQAAEGLNAQPADTGSASSPHNGVWQPLVRRQSWFGADIQADALHGVLRDTTVGGPPLIRNIVPLRVGLNFEGWQLLRVRLQVPLIVFQDGSIAPDAGPTLQLGAPSISVGIGRELKDVPGLTLGLNLVGLAPVGARSRFLADPSIDFIGLGAAQYSLGGAHITANFGIRSRTAQSVRNTSIGLAAIYRFGVAYDFNRFVTLGVELLGESRSDTAGGSPIEVLGRLLVRPHPVVALSMTGGGGITNGLGAPAWRAGLGIEFGFSPSASSTLHDDVYVPPPDRPFGGYPDPSQPTGRSTTKPVKPETAPVVLAAAPGAKAEEKPKDAPKPESSAPVTATQQAVAKAETESKPTDEAKHSAKPEAEPKGEPAPKAPAEDASALIARIDALAASTPAKITAADRDSDYDGITDEIDRCPNAPEDEDGFMDRDGCPDLDDDSDGVPDTRDDCPRIFGPGLAANGCPAILRPEEVTARGGKIYLRAAPLGAKGSAGRAGAHAIAYAGPDGRIARIWIVVARTEAGALGRELTSIGGWANSIVQLAIDSKQSKSIPSALRNTPIVPLTSAGAPPPAEVQKRSPSTIWVELTLQRRP